jgi:hypothetical protein
LWVFIFFLPLSASERNRFDFEHNVVHRVIQAPREPTQLASCNVVGILVTWFVEIQWRPLNIVEPIPGSREDCTLRGGVAKLVVAAGEVSMEGLGTSEQCQHFGRAVMCRYRGIMGWGSKCFNL